MLDGIGCRAAAVRRYFGEADVGALRPVATSASRRRRRRRHRGGAEGAVGGASAGRPLRPRPDRRPPARQDQGGQRHSRPALSTFGVGREFSAGGWRDLIDQLLFEGLLVEDPNDGRPLIGLGDAGGGAAGLSRRAAGRTCAARPRLHDAPARRARPQARAAAAGGRRRRSAAVRGPARLAARGGRRPGRAALCDLPRPHARWRSPATTPGQPVSALIAREAAMGEAVQQTSRPLWRRGARSGAGQEPRRGVAT